MLLTADILQRCGCARGVALTWAKPLGDACTLYAIDSRERMAPFIAETGTESAGFTRTVENLNYRAEQLVKTWPSRFTPELAKQVATRPDLVAENAYGGRMGNNQPGDGYRFRGRGLLQATGRANYEAVRDLLREKLPNVPDFLAMPEALAEPKWSALSAAALWSEWGLNALADAGDLLGISRRINLGDKNSPHMPNGWEDRRARFAQARAALAQVAA